MRACLLAILALALPAAAAPKLRPPTEVRVGATFVSPDDPRLQFTVTKVSGTDVWCVGRWTRDEPVVDPRATQAQDPFYYTVLTNAVADDGKPYTSARLPTVREVLDLIGGAW